VTLRITDDGIGIDANDTRRSGLRNLAERARTLGGGLHIQPGPERGTILEWRVPLG
jgi:two-component system, NarL family, sensor histidine kinase DevS